MEGLDASPVIADVVGAPPAPEFVAAGGELANEVLEVFVMRISTGFGAQDCNANVGGPVPVRVELVGGAIEEGEPGEVRWPARVAIELGVEGSRKAVGRKQVHPPVADEGCTVCDGVQGPLQAGPWGPPLCGAAAWPHDGAGPVGGTRQVEQVRPFGVVELEGARDRVEDGGGDTGKGAAFELGEVLDAHPRERGNLAAAQSGDASRTHVGQTCLPGGDLGSPR